MKCLELICVPISDFLSIPIEASKISKSVSLKSVFLESVSLKPVLLESVSTNSFKFVQNISMSTIC
jgi:hypothetical protein